MKKKLVTKSFLFSFLILTSLLPGFSKDKTFSSRWAAAPPIIDGYSNEWKDEALNFEKKVRVEYAFKNNEKNLFVLFIFKDPKYLSTIRATGITLWFNTDGRKKKNYGIKFIKRQVSAKAFISLLEQRRGPLSEEEKNKIGANPYYLLHNTTVISKKSKSASQAAKGGETKPAFFRSMKQKKMVVYEFAIPLTKLAESTFRKENKSGKAIKIGFEWGGMTPAMKAARMRRSANAGAGLPETGRPSSSLSTGSSYRRGMASLGRSPKKYSFWVDVQLAKNL